MRRTAPPAYARLGGASLPHLALLGDGGSALQSNTTTSVREPLRESPGVSSGRVLREEPLLSIVVPTKNERGNVVRLIERLEAVLPTVAMEIIFVDASSDGTAEAVEEAAGHSKREIVAPAPGIQPAASAGLGGAVVQGLRAARAPWVCVMDADLQHPPELITALLEQAEARDLDLVVASRYCEPGERIGFGWARAMASRSSTTVARLLFPQRLREVTDPMSGFFLVRRDAIALDDAATAGVQDPARDPGASPGAAGRRGVVQLRRAARRPEQGDDPRGVALPVAARAAAVRPLRGRRASRAGREHARAGPADRCGGAVLPRLGRHRDPGIDAVELLLHRALGLLGSRPQARAGDPDGAVLPHEQRRPGAEGALLVLLTSGLGIHYVVSNVISLVGLTLVRFALADTWIWAKARPAESPPGPYGYDIHGIVSVLSDARLPELERFRVGALAGEPDIRVRLGRVAANGDGPRDPLPRGSARLRGVDRDRRADRGDRLTAASVDPRTSSTRTWSSRSCAGRSPSGATRSSTPPAWRAGDDAFLVTARTDTGKTTTSLRMLDREAVLVPLRRPDAGEPGRAGADLSQAAHDQPAHVEGRQDAAADSPRARRAWWSRAVSTRARGAASR